MGARSALARETPPPAHLSQNPDRACQSAMHRAPTPRVARAPGPGAAPPGSAARARWLHPVARALDAAPAPVAFFFRDDDAGWGDARLAALLDVFASHATWLDLAVIPRALDAGLARELLAREGVGLHQHGLAHANHEPEGLRRCEFGPARPAALQRADIVEGRERLEDLLGERAEP